MIQSLEEKYDRLKRIIIQAGSAAVAFSGGVDSTFLLKVCFDLLGDKALAVTARSETFPKHEYDESIELAKQIGAKQILIVSRELEVHGFSDNPPHRCYLCKTELFSKVKETARKHGVCSVFDGSNADDLSDFRPGRIAARQLGVRSPLEEAGLTKKEIRTLSARIKLSTWNKPSFACLSSRFPYYTKITKAALQQVENAESYLLQLGMRVFRVRHHDTIARIELGKKEMEILWERGLGDQILQHFKSLGYRYVTLDLEGYRMGSMNEALTEDESNMKYLVAMRDTHDAF